ncbi:ABC transporter permease [Pontibacter sp. G13]|uniref:ABC transporter permease n=1 Tax=Pontibacter sp. G13 TaxID=3074898 RepID=UPI00288A923F|nr:ABC transporter permease [Pontibacter sp. G13]WNJ16980.1 ABC transporter permease [Pontibacter sp. G13]
MFKNYFLISIRNLIRDRGTTWINLLGLTIGMTACLVICLYVFNEWSFDRFHKDHERMYRVLTIDKALGVSNSLVGIAMPATGPTMKADFPEVEEITRIYRGGRELVSNSANERQVFVEDFIYVEPSFFQMFDFPLVKGDAHSALTEPNTAVLTQSLAEKIFGSESPIGKMVEVGPDESLEIVGVLEDVPHNSHLRFDLVGSLQPEQGDSNLVNYLNSWGSISMITYAKVQPGTDEVALEEKMETMIRQHDVGENFQQVLQPLDEAHLGSTDILFDNHNQNKGNLSELKTLLVVALFVLLIAAFNFMNLATARSAKRAKEVGLRKVVGAIRHQLIGQFIGEAVLLCLLGFGLSLIIAAVASEWITTAYPRNLIMLLWEHPMLLLLGLAGTVLLGLLAGGYPAWLISSYTPVSVLKGSFLRSGKGIWLRRSLVVLQFAASIAMISGTWIVYRQLDHIQNVDKGFEAEQVITVPLTTQEARTRFDALKETWLAIPAVQAVGNTNSMPGEGYGRRGILPEGVPEEDVWIVSATSVDPDYFEVMNMELAAGRDFSDRRRSDTLRSLIINETAASKMGWEDDAVGKQISLGDNQFQVIGLLKDFHYTSLRHEIEPLVIFPSRRVGRTAAIKVQTSDMRGTVAQLEEAWESVNPTFPFEYAFFDEQFAQQFEREEAFATQIVAFTWLAIIIACMGLLGLSAFHAEVRTKEIGIRKVLGAPVTNMIILLSREFAWLVGVAAIVAVPISWIALEDWLSGFAYRIEMGWWVFAASGALALSISLLTNAWHAIKTARANPIRALRYE